MPITIPAFDVQDVQMMPNYRIEEFNKRVTKFAKTLWLTMAAEQKATSHVRPLKALDPEIGLMCGIVQVAEDDLDGDLARTEYLKENL